MIPACLVWIITEVGPCYGPMPLDHVNEMLFTGSFKPDTLVIGIDDQYYSIKDIWPELILVNYQFNPDYVVPEAVRKEVIRGLHESNQ